MHDESMRPMSIDNVEEFDVLVCDFPNLVVSVVPRQAPWNTTVENYELSQP